jgi:hypothetical protein
MTAWIDPVLRCGSEVDLSGIVDGVMGGSSSAVHDDGRGRSGGASARNEALIDLDVDFVEDNAAMMNSDSGALPPPGFSSVSGWGRQRRSESPASPGMMSRSWSGLMLTVANPSPASPATVRGRSSVDLTPEPMVGNDGRRRGSFSSLRDVPASLPSVCGSTFRSAANVDLGLEEVRERNGSFASLRERPVSASSHSTVTTHGREKRNWLERSPVGRRVELTIS